VIRRFASTILVACAVCAGSCIVTDKIEFEDYVNNPPEVIEVDPPNTQVERICLTEQTFKVVVWDPDEGDAASYAARLRMWLTSNPDPQECVVTEVSTAGEQVDEYKTGVRLNVECSIELQQYAGIEEGTLIPFQVQVSDLGFLAQATIPAGARTADVVWVREVAPDEVECLVP